MAPSKAAVVGFIVAFGVFALLDVLLFGERVSLWVGLVPGALAAGLSYRAAAIMQRDEPYSSE